MKIIRAKPARTLERIECINSIMEIEISIEPKVIGWRTYAKKAKFLKLLRLSVPLFLIHLLFDENKPKIIKDKANEEITNAKI